VCDGEPPLAGNLRDHLLRTLPSYMVPVAFAFVDELPQSTNGKIDRKALTALAAVGVRPREYVAPRTPVEEMIAGIWRDVLGLERIGADDNFFELGGSSLQLARVSMRLDRVLGVRLPLRGLFECPRLSDLASELVGGLVAADSDGGAERLLEEMERTTVVAAGGAVS
jgi:acyl carrier protein